MIRDDAIAEVAFRLGRRTDLDADILRNMKLQQIILEGNPMLPWFLLTEFAQTTTTVGEERIIIPSDFIREPEDESALWVYDVEADDDEEWREIVKAQYDVIKTEFTGSGEPTRYALVGGYFRLRPIPDDTYTIKIIYYAKAEVLDTNVENLWLLHAPELLIAKTTKVLAGVLGKADALAQASESEARELDRLVKENVARAEANRSRTMGEAP